MARHRDLTGPAAIHPVAFVQGTDPALVAGNGVLPGKAWIDTANNYAWKIRNDANSGWITVLGPAPAGLSVSMTELVLVYTLGSFYFFDDFDTTELEYIP